MSEAGGYVASPIKRSRRTKAEMEAIRAALYDAVAAEQPMTVRQVFYRLAVDGVVPKTDDSKGYGTVQRLLVEMRRAGELPYTWVADSTRWMRKPTTFSSAEHALRRTAQTYRRALWDEAPAYAELWLEKDALAGVLVDTSDEWDVPLMVTRGYPSMSFLHSAAEAILAREDQHTHIYYFGDHDPSGRDIDRAVVEGIGESLVALTGETFSALATFERIAVTQEQITEWSLPTRPTKRTDSRSRAFTGRSVELDAIPAHRLRDLARECIERHVDAHELRMLQIAEAEERRLLLEMVEAFKGEES